MMHSAHFIYSDMALKIVLETNQIFYLFILYYYYFFNIY